MLPPKRFVQGHRHNNRSYRRKERQNPDNKRRNRQSLQKSLKRPGASAVYTAVDVIDRWPSHSWIALVSCPLGERIAASVAKHVRMRLQLKAGSEGRALDHPGKAAGRERCTALADEHEG